MHGDNATYHIAAFYVNSHDGSYRVPA